MFVSREEISKDYTTSGEVRRVRCKFFVNVSNESSKTVIVEVSTYKTKDGWSTPTVTIRDFSLPCTEFEKFTELVVTLIERVKKEVQK